MTKILCFGWPNSTHLHPLSHGNGQRYDAMFFLRSASCLEGSAPRARAEGTVVGKGVRSANAAGTDGPKPEEWRWPEVALSVGRASLPPAHFSRRVGTWRSLTVSGQPAPVTPNPPNSDMREANSETPHVWGNPPPACGQATQNTHDGAGNSSCEASTKCVFVFVYGRNGP